MLGRDHLVCLGLGAAAGALALVAIRRLRTRSPRTPRPRGAHTVTRKLGGSDVAVTVLGMGGVGVMPPEQVRLQKDYEFFQVGIRLGGAAVGEMGFKWQCQEGLLAHMDKVVQEYRESRGLLPLRATSGPPSS